MRLRFHEYWWVSVIAIAGPLALALGGCSGRTSLPTAPFSLDPNAIAQDEPEPKPRPGVARKPVVPCPTAARFDRSAFHTPTVIDNPYSPLIPGTQYVLSGQANRGGGLLPHTVVFTVTDVTKEIDGIKTIALWDRDFNEGVLAEEELAFFAQDDYGNIW